MAMSDDPQQTPRQASKGEVRILGGFFVIGALVLIFAMDRDMAIHGIIPVWWVGIGLLAPLGLCMLLFPSASFFRGRAGRFSDIGERVLGRRDKKQSPPPPGPR